MYISVALRLGLQGSKKCAVWAHMRSYRSTSDEFLDPWGFCEESRA